MEETSNHTVESSLMPGISAFTPGALFGDYRLIRQLGRGGMGEVWEVCDEKLQTHRALKLFSILSTTQLESKLREKFSIEARLMSELNHPNLVRVFDYGEVGPTLYYVMDFVGIPPKLSSDVRNNPALLITPPPPVVAERTLEPLTLAQLIEAPRAIPIELVVRFYADLREALAYCHARGIVHADIKPENILVSSSGHLLLTDFGIARILDKNVRKRLLLPAVTLPNLAGSVRFVAPELLQGAKPTPAADVYALGVLFFKLLTGIWFEGSARLLRAAINLAPAQQPLLRHMLISDPAHRIASGQELPAVLPIKQAWYRACFQKFWWRVSLGVLVLLLVVSGLGVYYFLGTPILGLRRKLASTLGVYYFLGTPIQPSSSDLDSSATAEPATVAPTSTKVAAPAPRETSSSSQMPIEQFDALTCGRQVVEVGASRVIAFTNTTDVVLPDLALMNKSFMRIERPIGTRSTFSTVSAASSATLELCGPTFYERPAKTVVRGKLRLTNGVDLSLTGGSNPPIDRIDAGSNCVVRISLATNGRIENVVYDVELWPTSELILSGGLRLAGHSSVHWIFHDQTRATVNNTFVGVGMSMDLHEGHATLDLGAVYVYHRGFEIIVRDPAAELDLSLTSLFCYDYWHAGGINKWGEGTFTVRAKPSCSNAYVGGFPVNIHKGTLRLLANWTQDPTVYSQKGKTLGDWTIAPEATLVGENTTLTIAPTRTAHVRGTLAGDLTLSHGTFYTGAILRPTTTIHLGTVCLADTPEGSPQPTIRVVQTQRKPGILLTWREAPASWGACLNVELLPGFKAKVTENNVEVYAQ